MTLKKLTNDHYIIVDDSEIKINDWVYSMDGVHQYFGLILNTEPLPKKIIYSTQPLEQGYGCEIKEGLMLRNVGKELCYDLIKPLSLSEVKELIGEVDVEKKAYLAAQKKFKLEHIPLEQVDEYGGVIKEFVQNFINTYNQALEDNKNNKYTEQDMRRYHNIMCLYGNKKGEEFIHSLQPKTEWEVEFIDGKLTLKK